MMLQSPHRIKKVVFSELPSDFVLFKQYNISAEQMYQKLFPLHSVDATYQEDASGARLCDSFGGGRLESGFSAAVQS